ncbi:hypothetical protein [Flavobacterium sp. HSC-61S13]|uniref:hypothetical protein n=1 Tax=Flavobacterium sp. HSC-61S13 TaxID=2910963 RepID=UPI0020A13D39|nr:hypothetical protein [Flavobacterium sp. HSC-61S13]MCP1996317.1 hypothetical protein [Flavobacterium sp. HSC-61S13]
MRSVIEKFIDIQKGILSDFSMKWEADTCEETFRDDVKNYYGFENKFGWNIMLNSYYVLDDTELAKASFIKFQLQGPYRHKDTGERYLCLYGLLNSVYQQKIAIDNLVEIFKVPNSKLISKPLNNCAIIILRNKIAAHPSNYSLAKEDSEHKFDVYEISRPDLDSDSITLLRNQNHFEKYDLIEILKEFDDQIENILELITTKIIKKIFNNNGKYYQNLDELKQIRDGAIICGDEIIRFK